MSRFPYIFLLYLSFTVKVKVMSLIDMIFLTILVFLTLGLTVFFVTSLYYNFKLPAPYVPSRSIAVRKILEEIDLSDKSSFIELGVGDGKVISAIAKKYPQMKCIGIEYNWVPYLLARFRNLFLRNKVEYKIGDFFEFNLSKYDVVYTYLFSEVMYKLEDKFEKELAPSSILISNTFQLKNKKPFAIYKGEAWLSTIYLYKY